jgi:hypothetical protein
MKALEHIDRIHISNAVLKPLLKLYEHQGKTYYYDELYKRDQEALYKKCLEDNMHYLLSMVDDALSDQRLKTIIKKDFQPKNQQEIKLKNLKRALELIHEASEIELLTNEFDDLSKLLSKNLAPNSFKYDTIEGEALLNFKRVSRRVKLEKLITLYHQLHKKNEAPIPHLLANFYVDFINLDIFDHDNELLGMMMLYMMMREQFKALHYIPFFKYFKAHYQAFKQGMIAANYYWDSGYAQTEFITQVILDVLIICYDELETHAHTYQFEVQLNKTDSIENTILKLPQVFKKDDIRKMHPTISDATIDRTLARLKEEQKIRPLGKGRSTKWQQLQELDIHKKIKQLSLFGDES